MSKYLPCNVYFCEFLQSRFKQHWQNVLWDCQLKKLMQIENRNLCSEELLMHCNHIKKVLIHRLISIPKKCLNVVAYIIQMCYLTWILPINKLTIDFSAISTWKFSMMFSLKWRAQTLVLVKLTETIHWSSTYCPTLMFCIWIGANEGTSQDLIWSII